MKKPDYQAPRLERPGSLRFLTPIEIPDLNEAQTTRNH